MSNSPSPQPCRYVQVTGPQRLVSTNGAMHSTYLALERSKQDMPEIAAGNKSVLFGDLNYYWIGDRQGISFKRLNELYANNGQVGFLASKRVDGKTVLPEAIKILQQHA